METQVLNSGGYWWVCGVVGARGGERLPGTVGAEGVGVRHGAARCGRGYDSSGHSAYPGCARRWRRSACGAVQCERLCALNGVDPWSGRGFVGSGPFNVSDYVR